MPTIEDVESEVSFISSVNADGTLALYGFYAWNGDSPATYGGGYTQAMKWGADTAGTPGGTVSYYFDPRSNWTATEQQAFTAGLALWSAEANINFVQTNNATAAQITFTRNRGGYAETDPNYSESSIEGLTGGTHLVQLNSVTVSIDTSVAGFGPIGSSFNTDGGYPWTTLLHEEGHALGLGHAGPYNEGSNGNNFDAVQFSAFDSRLWSIMSYIDPSDTNAAYYSQYLVTGTNWGYTNGYPNEPTTPMALDILGAQQLYGAPTSTPLSGGQVFGFQANITGAIAPFFDFTKNTMPIITIWDAGGNNTLNLSGWSSPAIVNLNPGTFSSCDGLTNNICIAFNTAIDTFYSSEGGDTVTSNNDGDTIYGGFGNDTLIGGSGNDILDGGAGSNFLNGGAGMNKAVFDGERDGYTITRDANGTLEVVGSGQTDTLENIELLSFSDVTILADSIGHHSSSDFDGNGNSDLLFQNSNGQAAVWLMNGTTPSTIAYAGGNPGSAWAVVGSGDFNGAGNSDILFQNSNGQVAEWLMSGTTVNSFAYVGGNPGTTWTVVGTGDFNGDGYSDIVLQNGNGNVAEWLTNGTTLSSFGEQTVTSDWKVVGTGDFNGDGECDLLFQNSNGQVAIWLMNGATPVATSYVGGNPGASWKVVGTGEFFGNRDSDILFQNTSGQVEIWEMNGTSVVAASYVGGNPGAGWNVVGTGDYNGDGMSDILFQNTNTGQAAVWLMNGFTPLTQTAVGPTPGTAWHLIAGTG